MVKHVALLGPATPRDLAHHFYPGDRARALDFVGYRGIPVSDLASALLDSGVVVEVLTYSPFPGESGTFEGPRVRVQVVAGHRSAAAKSVDRFKLERAGLATLLANSDAPVLHAHWSYEFALPALVSGRPTMVTAHDAPWTVLSQMTSPLRIARVALAVAVRKQLIRLGPLSLLVVPSPYLRGAWENQMRFREPITVIPNLARGVPASDLAGTADIFDTSGPTLLSVGNASRLKNVRTLLLALPLVREAHPTVRLSLVGPGLGPGDPLARWAAVRGVSEGVEFVGAIEPGELSCRYATATALVHPSREESFGLTLVEALSRGLPVVAGRNSGAVAWTLDHGRGGVLVDIHEPRSISQGVCWVLEHPLDASQLADQGRTYAQTTFAPERIVASYRAAYQRLAGAAR